MARPTAASAAATVMMKIAKICPVRFVVGACLAKATSVTMTPFSITSIAMSTVMAFRLDSAPAMPIANNAAPSRRPCCSVIGYSGGRAGGILLLARNHDGADHRDEQEDRRYLERQDVG